ncbi:hypothetical protein GE061_007850 [Apolygus lucorum]|uniref:Uncharacterized protein n=1 Tax=Apolygus lucorum TaxID=248454 RepID=A0A8S9WN10_APOLU|nr:hypothetical protein GE061_007850 [Apolygus lucorum]
MALDREGILWTVKPGTSLQFSSMELEAPLPIPRTDKISWNGSRLERYDGMALDREGIFWTGKPGTCLQFSSMYQEAPLSIPQTDKISWNGSRLERYLE